MRILTVTQGEYGNRITANIQRHCPADWTVESWVAPRVLPPVIDYPEEYLPAWLPPADLLLSLGEHPGIAEFLPDIAQMTGAKAVLAPIDNVQWMPPGLMRQLTGWLAELNVPVIFPKPFCTLTERTYNANRLQVEYDAPLVAEFARHFGRPTLNISVDEATKCIVDVAVERDAACGCARHVAGGLVGVSVEEAGYAAGMLHHHYPCLAAMAMDPDYNDTLLHVSGHILRDETAGQVKPFKELPIYLRPQ
ncbi:MAG: hypothetical protein HY328_07515 [Chloroflexi bacterium]|nr:hypothetical protein [Chloroflexota bacterium]